MHRSLLPILIAASGVLAAPQNTGLENLSQCAQGQALIAIGTTDCAPSDTTCLCTGTAFQDALRNGIATSCGPADVAAAEAFGATICASVGAPVPSDPTSAPDPVANPPTPPAGESEYEDDTSTSPDTDTDTNATPPPPTDDTTTNPVSAPAENTTVWINGTCHHCPGGDAHPNGTAPPPSTPPTNPGGTGSSNPLFTGAANALVGSALTALAAAAAAAALL